MKQISVFLCLACLLYGAMAFSPVSPPASPTDLSPEQVQDFEEATEVLLEKMGDYLKKIASERDASKVARYRLHFEDLFLDKNQSIEVGWIYNNALGKKSYNVPAYVDRLLERKASVYSKVDLEAYKKASVDAPFALFKKNEKIYKARYNFYQIFKGYQKDNAQLLLYADSTIKKVEVFAKMGNPDQQEVKLGNITIDQIFLITEQENAKNRNKSFEQNSVNSEKSFSKTEQGNAQNKSFEGNNMTARGAQPSNKTTLNETIDKTGASVVQVRGRRGTITRVLSLKAFREKCNFDEFLRYEYKETIQKNGAKIAIIQLR